MGQIGQLSRILNNTLTPVTHHLLATVAAPGQLSVTDIMNARVLNGQIRPSKVLLFGSPISLSPSPSMHNAGYKYSFLLLIIQCL